MTHPCTGRHVRSPETWAAIREAYLSGKGAGAVCRAFGVGRSTLRDRARREGWRRRDQPDSRPAPEPSIEEVLEAPTIDFHTVVELMWRRVLRSVEANDPVAAERWWRLLGSVDEATHRLRTCMPLPEWPEHRAWPPAFPPSRLRAGREAAHPDSPDSSASSDGADAAGGSGH